MAKDPDPITVKIQAEFSKFKSDLAEVKKSLNAIGKDGSKAGENLEKSFFAASIKANLLTEAIKAAAGSVLSMTKSIMDNAKEQRLWANRLNVNLESFSQLVAVGRRFGAQTDDVGDSIKDLNERIADAARGNKTYEGALNMVGLKSKELIDLPIAEQFIKVADAIGKMTNAGDQNFATAELMADAGFRLLPAFRAGEKGIREMMAAAKELGSAFSEDEVKLYQDFDSALIRLKESSIAAAKPITNNLTSALTGAANATADVLEKTIAYRTELEALRKELTATAESGKVMSSEIGEIETGLAPITGSFDLLAQSAKQTGEDVEGVMAQIKASVGREGIQIPDLTGGGLKVDGDINEMFNEALEGPNMSEMFEEALNAQEEYEMSILDIKRRSVKAQTDLEKWKNKFNIAETQSALKTISTLMYSENRKMFEAGKVAAIADATINTYMGANKALGSAPPPFNFALAAGVIAAGIANVQKIASTTMGGGGGGVSAGVTGQPGGLGAQQAAPENVIDATFNIQSESGMVSADQIRGIAAGLNELTEDGGKIRSVKVL